jgi:hypothetical protein
VYRTKNDNSSQERTKQVTTISGCHDFAAGNRGFLPPNPLPTLTNPMSFFVR